MATRSVVREKLAASMGLKPMTVERTLRVLGVAGLIPSEGPGKRLGHFGAEALKNIVLGAMAPTPSEAAKVAVALDELVFEPNRLAQMGEADVNGTPCGIPLGRYVQNLIQLLSDEDVAQSMMSDGADSLYLQPLEIVAEFDPTQAYVTRWSEGNEGRIIEFFIKPGSSFSEKKPGLQHGSRLRLSVLVEAGDLLRDTFTYQVSPTPDPAPGSAGEGEATPETTKASGTGIHEGLQSPQPKVVPTALARTAFSNKTQSATSKGSKQSLPTLGVRESQVCQSTTSLERTRHYGSHWTDAASPPPG